MFSHPCCFALVPMALLLASAPQASADFIPWSYSTTVTPTGPYAGNARLYSTDPAMFVTLTGLSGQETGSTWAGSFKAAASGITVHPNEIGGLDGTAHSFDLTVTLTDKYNGVTGSLVFHGYVFGAIFGGAKPGDPVGGMLMSQFDIDQNKSSFKPTLLINNQYDTLNSPAKSLLLGNHFFTVATTTTDEFYHGSSAQMYVQVTTVPEPSTIVLAVAGLAGLGLRTWRRRRPRSPLDVCFVYASPVQRSGICKNSAV